MRTFVRILTTIVVLIVFTSAAGLRAKDVRHPMVLEPRIIEDRQAPNVFGSDLGISRRVGLDPELRAWGGLEAALSEFDIVSHEPGLIPLLTFGDDLFNFDLPNFEESQFALLVAQQPTDILPEPLPLDTSVVITRFQTTSSATPIRAAQNTGIPFSNLNRTRGLISGIPTALSQFTFAPPQVSSRTVVIERFSQQTFASPVPLPPAILMLLGAIAALVGTRRRV